MPVMTDSDDVPIEDARTLVMKIAEYIADCGEKDSRFLYPEHLRATWVEADGLMSFVCKAVGVDPVDVNAHLDRVGK